MFSYWEPSFSEIPTSHSFREGLHSFVVSGSWSGIKANELSRVIMDQPSGPDFISLRRSTELLSKIL